MRILLLATVAAGVLAGCSSHGAATPAAYSSAGDAQCSLDYRSSGGGTVTHLASTVAGEADVSSAGIGTAERRSVAVTAGGTTTIQLKATSVTTLSATLTTAAGHVYHCSVKPAAH